MGISKKFSAIFKKGNNFGDFQFASLDKTLPTWGQLFNPLALRKAKIVCNFGLFECKMVKKTNCS